MMPKKPKSSPKSYEIGYQEPPKKFQFKKGQSGNPTGKRRKGSSIVPNLKALLERALNRTVTLRDSEQKKIVTKAAAGIEQLVNQFATGDHRARRDLIALAGTLGVDLTAGHGNAIERRSPRDYQQTTKPWWTTTFGAASRNLTLRMSSI
jgi:hypothetical protein